MSRIALRDLQAKHKRLLAYAHPLRERVMTRLADVDEASPSEITRALGLDRKWLSKVDQQIKKLVELDCAEFLHQRTTGSMPENVYRATVRAIVDYGEWEDLLREDPAFAEYQVVRAKEVQVDDFVTSFKANLVGKDEEFHLTRHPRTMDSQALRETLDAVKRLVEEVDEIERRSAQRREETGSPGFPVSDCHAVFKMPPA